MNNKKMNSESLTMSIPELASCLNISKALAYSLAKREALPVRVIKLGEKRIVVSRREVENLFSGIKNEDPNSNKR